MWDKWGTIHPLHRGWVNLVWLNYYLLFFFPSERRFSDTPLMLVSCLCNLSARTSSPHLIQLHKNSLTELFGDEIGKKSHRGPFVPCFTSVHELLLLSGGGLEVSPQHSPHRGTCLASAGAGRAQDVLWNSHSCGIKTPTES